MVRDRCSFVLGSNIVLSQSSTPKSQTPTGLNREHDHGRESILKATASNEANNHQSKVKGISSAGQSQSPLLSR